MKAGNNQKLRIWAATLAVLLLVALCAQGLAEAYITSVISSSTSCKVGDAVTWTTNYYNGYGTMKFIYRLYRNGAQYGQKVDSRSNSYSYTFTAPGTYYLEAQAVDGNNEYSSRRSSANVTVVSDTPQVTGVTCVAQSASTVGAVVSASGSPNMYLLSLYRGDVLVQSTGWIAQNATVFYSVPGGVYHVRAQARNASGAISPVASSSNCKIGNPPTLAAVSVSSTACNVKTPMTWTPIVTTAGAGGLTYAYVLYKDGVIARNSGWVSSASNAYTPTTAGTYFMNVTVRDSTGALSQTVSSPTAQVTVPPVTLARVTASATTQEVNNQITWTPVITSQGTGSLQYYYIIFKDNAVVKGTGWISAASYSYTPTEAGFYYATAQVRDSMNTLSTVAASPTTNVTRKTPKLTGLTVSKTNILTGQELEVACNASAGTGTLTVYFDLYRNGTLADTWLPTIPASFYEDDLPKRVSFKGVLDNPGTYYFKGYARDSAGVSSQISTSSAFTVADSGFAITNVTASARYAVLGSSVTWTVTTTGAESAVRYDYKLYKDGQSAAVASQSDVTQNTFSHTLTEAGDYSLTVEAYDSTLKCFAKPQYTKATVTISNKPIVTSLNASTQNAQVGGSVTWTPVVAFQGNGVEKFTYSVYNDGAEIVKDAVSTDSAYTFVFPTAGVYSARVTATSNDNHTSKQVTSPETTVTLPVPALSAVAASSLSVEVGDSVTWTPAIASVGMGELEYNYVIYKNNAVVKGTGWIDLPSYAYIPAEPGAYRVSAKVRDSYNTVSATLYSPVTMVTAPVVQPPVISAVNASVTKAQAGEQVVWTPVVQSEGAGSVKYNYVIYRNGSVVKGTGWISGAPYRYALPSAGTYSVQVRIRDSAGTVSATVSSPNTFAESVSATPALSAVKASVTKTKAGEQVVWTPVVQSEGAGSVKYNYVIYRNGSVVKGTGWISGAPYRYTLPSAGTYSVQVRIRDSAGTESARISSPNTFVESASAAPALSAVKASVTKTKAGEQVVWTPVVQSEGTGSVKYNYVIYRNGSVVKGTGWISGAPYRYTLPSAGTYSVQVRIRDSAGTVSATVSSPNTFVESASAAPALSAVSASVTKTKAGEQVVWTPVVQSEGTGSVKYNYVIYRNGSVVKGTGWISGAPYRYTLPSAGTYSVQVRIRDSAGTVSATVSSPNTFVESASATPALSAVNTSVTDRIVWTPVVQNDGAGSLKYYYTIYRNGSVVKGTGWIGTKAYAYTPTTPGTYSVVVRIKDSAGAVSGNMASSAVIKE